MSGITACRPDLKQLHVRCRALAPHSLAWAASRSSCSTSRASVRGNDPLPVLLGYPAISPSEQPLPPQYQGRPQHCSPPAAGTKPPAHAQDRALQDGALRAVLLHDPPRAAQQTRVPPTSEGNGSSEMQCHHSQLRVLHHSASSPERRELRGQVVGTPPPEASLPGEDEQQVPPPSTPLQNAAIIQMGSQIVF